MSRVRDTRKLKNLSPADIQPNPNNPRLIFRQEEMEHLMVSIDSHGIQVPIVVYKDGDFFTLIDGERRWRCAKTLNLKTVPALIQDKPSELDNLLLMYNIHALREQWDYFTIASKLQRVIDLIVQERGDNPTESQLSSETGLSRGQIRRCRLILNLPEKYKNLLLEELELPKSQQKLSEDFFLEMEKSLKTVVGRIPEYEDNLDEVRDTLVKKFKNGTIPAITDFRHLAKIATAVDNLDVAHTRARKSLDQIFDSESEYGIREVYESAVEFEYDEKKAARNIDSLRAFLYEVLEEDHKNDLDEDFILMLRDLYKAIKIILKD